jgi:amino acid transporter
MNVTTFKHALLGAPRDLFGKETRQHIALVSFLAWIGLGADGLSSACYGPQEAFLALGGHVHLGIYLAIATIITVFVISLAYIQIIEIFPSGGGGYKVATNLLGSHAGLISGAALVVDYVLTTAISVASGIDAIFSLLPLGAQAGKIIAEVGCVLFLVYLNMRGMKESIKFMLPIFLGFVITHLFLIVAGILGHKTGLGQIMPVAVSETFTLADHMGWVFVLSLLFKAISLGGGTYTGLEAVSNNVNALAEPRVRTGKWTMFYVATSLAAMAAGIVVLYILWPVEYAPGQTLNAMTFREIMAGWNIGGLPLGPWLLPVVLFLEAGLLLVAANTGLLAGPTVLANMATDKWMPHFFASLSSRLVKKNGIMLMGAAALGALWITDARVDVLVVLYSINVFITFSLSMLGLCVYWLRNRHKHKHWLRKLCLAAIGFVMTSTILVITVIEKYSSGGWLTLLVTTGVVVMGYVIHKSYARINDKLEGANKATADEMQQTVASPVHHVNIREPGAPTAVFVIDEHNIAGGLYCMKWVKETMPNVYKNFIFVSVGEVVVNTYDETFLWDALRSRVRGVLKMFVSYSRKQGVPAISYLAFGTDIVEKITDLTKKIQADFPHAVFFTSKYIFLHENIFTRFLYNETSYIIQRRLHNLGCNMIVVPMKA